MLHAIAVICIAVLTYVTSFRPYKPPFHSSIFTSQQKFLTPDSNPSLTSSSHSWIALLIETVNAHNSGLKIENSLTIHELSDELAIWENSLLNGTYRILSTDITTLSLANLCMNLIGILPEIDTVAWPVEPLQSKIKKTLISLSIPSLVLKHKDLIRPVLRGKLNLSCLS